MPSFLKIWTGIKQRSHYYQKVGLPVENGHQPWSPPQKKQAVEVCFSGKIISNNPRPFSFSQSQVKISESLKHLGLILDSKLTC